MSGDRKRKMSEWMEKQSKKRRLVKAVEDNVKDFSENNNKIHTHSQQFIDHSSTQQFNTN